MPWMPLQIVFGLSTIVGGSGSGLLLAYLLSKATFDHMNFEWSHQGRCSLNKLLSSCNLHKFNFKILGKSNLQDPGRSTKMLSQNCTWLVANQKNLCNFFKPNFDWSLASSVWEGSKKRFMILDNDSTRWLTLFEK